MLEQHTENKSIFFWMIFFSYGFVAAITYSSVAKITGHPLISLPVIALIASLLLLPFASLSDTLDEFRAKNILRPFLFSLGQVLIFKALEGNSTFSTFYSGAIGATVALLVGRVVLKEGIDRLSLFGVGLIVFGAYLVKNTASLTLFAVWAGVVQGSAVVLARKRSITGGNTHSMAFASMLFLCLFSLAFILKPGVTSQAFLSFNILQLTIAGLGFAALQSTYCYLSSHMKSWMLSISSNMRIPASIITSLLYGQSSISTPLVATSALITLGIAFIFSGNYIVQFLKDSSREV